MVTRVETYNPAEKAWEYSSTSVPDTGIFFYQHLPDGERKFYMVNCSKDDSITSIRKTPATNLVTIEESFDFRDNEEVELLTELTEGEEYVLNIKLNPSIPPILARFTHETVGRDLPNY